MRGGSNHVYLRGEFYDSHQLEAERAGAAPGCVVPQVSVPAGPCRHQSPLGSVVLCHTKATVSS